MTYDFRKQASTRKPLYDHSSEHTAYVISDYPSGYNARCRKRVWLEHKPKAGFRLVEQTSEKWYGDAPAENAPLRWNKPKASTYVNVAACMYLDENNHVQWDGLTSYSKPTNYLSFLKDFPHAELRDLKIMVMAYIGHLVNALLGKGRPLDEEEMGRSRKELEEWLSVAKAAKISPLPKEAQELVDGTLEATKVDPDRWKADRAEAAQKSREKKVEEAKATPGALSAIEFATVLREKADKIKDHILKIDVKTQGTGSVYVNYYNLPSSHAGGGAEAQNNRLMFKIDGFDRVNPDAPAPAVSLETSVNGIMFGPTMEDRKKVNQKARLRGKKATPAKIAEYLAQHLNMVASEIPPSLFKKA